MKSEKRAFILSIALPPMIVMAFLLGYVFQPTIVTGSDFDPVAEAYANIAVRYTGDVDLADVRRAAIEGMVAKLDAYSAFYTEEEWAKIHADQLEGRFGGVGIVVTPPEEGEEYIKVVSTLMGTPASDAGVRPGDLILSVDGRSLKGLGIDDAVKWIRGEVGTEVRLTLGREKADPFDVVIERAIVEIPAMRSEMIDPDAGIGYIHISRFQELTEEFDRKYSELEAKGLKGLVLDLRFNPGGLLMESVNLTNRFLDEGVIVSTEGRTEGDRRLHEADAESTRVRVPVVILVNEESASASEIFAGAIKDHGVAPLVGMPTYGKGLVQTPVGLSDGSVLKLTTAHYLTPNGTFVQKKKGKDYGIEPDYRVEVTDEEKLAIRARLEDMYGTKEWEELKDPQLLAGLEVLRAGMEGRAPAIGKNTK